MIYGEKQTGEINPNEELRKICLVGRYFQKKIGQPPKELSDDCEIYLVISDSASFKYNLIVRNNNYEFDKTDWEQQSFSITNEMAIKTLVQQGLTILVWESKRVFYTFTILNDPDNKANKIPIIR